MSCGIQDGIAEQTSSCEGAWFALQVRPQAERSVAAILHGKGYEEFLPLYTSYRKWSDRVKEVESPLFPGYLFCRMTSETVGKVVTTPGVVRIVGTRKIPIAIDADEIAAIQRIIQTGMNGIPTPYLAVGQKVRVQRGPLAGSEGIITRFKDRLRLIISVNLLLRSVAVEIDRDWIQ